MTILLKGSYCCCGQIFTQQLKRTRFQIYTQMLGGTLGEVNAVLRPLLRSPQGGRWIPYKSFSIYTGYMNAVSYNVQVFRSTALRTKTILAMYNYISLFICNLKLLLLSFIYKQPHNENQHNQQVSFVPEQIMISAMSVLPILHFSSHKHELRWGPAKMYTNTRAHIRADRTSLGGVH